MNEREEYLFPGLVEVPHVTRTFGLIVAEHSFETKSGYLCGKIRYNPNTAKFAVRVANEKNVPEASNFLFADTLKDLIALAIPVLQQYEHAHVPDFKPYIVMDLSDHGPCGRLHEGILALYYSIEWRAKHREAGKYYRVVGSLKDGHPVIDDPNGDKRSVHDRMWIVSPGHQTTTDNHHIVVMPYSDKALAFCKKVDTDVGKLRKRLTAQLASFAKNVKGAKLYHGRSKGR